MLVRLLDSVGQGERTSAEEVAKRVSTQLQQVTDVVAGELVGLSATELSARNVEKAEDMPDLTPPLIDLGFSTTPIFSPKSPPGGETPKPEIRAKAPAITPAPETIPGPLFPKQDVEDEGKPLAAPRRRLSDTIVAMAKSHRSPLSFALIGFILGVISGAGLMWALTALLRDTGSAAEHTDSTATVTASLPPEPASDPTALAASMEMGSHEPAAPAEMLFDTGQQVPSVLPLQEGTATPTDTEVSAVNPLGANPIVVEGLPIRSVTEIEYRGQTGMRVVHPLGPERVLTVESFPAAAAARPDNLGRVVVNLTPPDTVVGIVRMERYLVYTSAVIPEDSLRTLMTRLVEREQAN
ncbi:MAG: hypothetical protein JSW51_09600, partial [Gemmatimonadota bacterium]